MVALRVLHLFAGAGGGLLADLILGHTPVGAVEKRGGLCEADAEAIETAARYVGCYHWSPPHIGVCRVVDGMAHRVDRIKCAGNGQVPLQAAAAWIALSRSGD